MQPVRLEMSGFLSYREKEVIDFSLFDVACITGENGAGKSSILDAMTYALFGKARVNSGSALINNASDLATVVFDFHYNEILFRVIRRIFRNTKPAEVIFAYYDSDKESFITIGANSKSKTDEEIRNRLNLDYETFTTASFFLQGQADSFARSKSSDRKEVLAKILRLDRWEKYQTIAKDFRKEKNNELNFQRTALTQLKNKILDEPTLRTNLENLNMNLKKLEQEEQSVSKRVRSLERSLTEFETLRKEIQNKQAAFKSKNENSEQKESNLQLKNKQLSETQSLLARESEINFALNDLRNKERFIFDQRILEKDVEKLTVQLAAVDQRITEKTERIKSDLEQLRVRRAELDLEVQQIPKASADLAELRRLHSDSEEEAQKLRTLDEMLVLIDKFSSQYQSWLELENSIKSEEQQIQFKITRLTEQQTGASIASLEMEKISNSIEDQRREQTDLDAKIAALEEIQTRINVIDRELERMDTQLSQNNERLNHLSENHSPNCPTCERALSEQEKIALETKIKSEIGQQRLRISDLIDQKDQLTSSLQSIRSNYPESIQKHLEAVKINLTRLETLHRAAKEKADEWTVQKQEEFNQLTSSFTIDSPARRRLKQSRDLLEDAYAKVTGSTPPGNPREANENIIQQKQEVQTTRIQISNKLRSLSSLPQQIAETQAYLKTIESNQTSWLIEKEGQLKLLEKALADQSFLTAELNEKAGIEEQIDSLNYQPGLLNKTKVFVEANKSLIETEFTALQNARPRRLDLEKDIQQIIKDLEILKEEKSEIQQQIQTMEANLHLEEEVKAEKTSMDQILSDLRLKKDKHNQTIGEISQRLVDIDDAKLKIKNSLLEIGDLESDLANIEFAERAFGNKGIPAMLIEQAIPDLEEEANRLLAKLTDGFSIRIHTQKDYRDLKRLDTMETLEIEISDGSGSREYETYSGGEAFRVNFAIRLALSKLLAHRADAKLETLVIDEGFGSQDDDGKQKLVEAIRAIQPEFKKILVITHLEELKEKFDHRIEVQKIGNTSKIRVI